MRDPTDPFVDQALCRSSPRLSFSPAPRRRISATASDLREVSHHMAHAPPADRAPGPAPFPSPVPSPAPSPAAAFLAPKRWASTLQEGVEYWNEETRDTKAIARAPTRSSAARLPCHPCAPALDADQTLLCMCHNPRCPPPITVLTDAPLHAGIVQHHRAALDGLLPLARRVIPAICAGFNVVCLASTGSGITTAYLVPTLSRVLLTPPPPAPPTPTFDARPSLVVLAPTRELAYGIHAQAQYLTGASALRIIPVVRGVSPAEQFRELKQGCDVLVGTPGRLLDMVERRVVSLASVNCIVLDEADRLLDMGFEGQLREHFAKLPRTVQTVVNAVGFTEELQQFVEQHVPPNFLLIRSRPFTDKLV